MESTQKPSHLPDYDTDKDIGLILYKSARALKNAFAVIGRGIVAIALAFQIFLIFLLKNLLWLLIGAIIGLGYGFYKYKKAGPQYSSEMVLQANFNSSRPLYAAIDHLNILIGNSDRKELSRIFNISAEEAAKLNDFTVEPVKSELIIADLYKNKFLQEPVDKYNIRQDTFWTRTLPYKEFKKTLTVYDYPVHKITAVSYDPYVFSKIQNGITNRLLNNEFSANFRKAETENTQDDIRILSSAIKGLDTLRRTYNQKMLKGDDIPQILEEKVGQDLNRMTFVAPELELYDQLLKLKDELKASRRRAVMESNIVEIHSEFNSPGKRIPLLEENIFRFTLLGFLLALLILLLIRFSKFFFAFKKEGR